MRRRKRYFFLLVLIPILVVGLVGYLFIHYFLDPSLYKKIVEESLARTLDREIFIGKAKINFWGGIGIGLEDIRIKDRSLAFDLLQSKSLILKVKLLPLLKGEVKWKRIVLDRPSFHLIRNRNGRLNILDGSLTLKGIKTSQQKVTQTLLTLFGGSLTLQDGEISLLDESLGPAPLMTEIHSLNLQLSEVSHHKPFAFRLSGKIGHSKKEGRFSITGTIQNIPEDMDLSKGGVDAKVQIKGVETLHFWPYLKTLLPMNTISGDLDLNANYQGNFQGAFHASAKIRFKDLVFDYPEVFAYVITPKWMNLDLAVGYDLKNFQIPHLSLELPEVRVKAKGRIYEIGSERMGVDAEAQSGPFDLSEGKRFIPYRIITPDVSDPLFRAEGSGPVQILSVKLSGKISEIEHCDQPAYAHTLSIEMKANGARLKLPWNLPPLEDVKGHLSFKDGHLKLREVEGRVFHSLIDRANGTFYQLLLIPTLQIHGEGRIDLKDFPSLMKIEGLSDDLSEILSPIHILSGRADYRLFAKAILKPPLRFQHQGSYHLWRVRFTHPQIPFPLQIGEGGIELSNEGLQWSGVKVEFRGSSFLMNGSWRKGERGNPFEMIAKGRGDLKNLFTLSQSPLFPEEIRLRIEWIKDLSGMAELSFRGQSQTGLKMSSYEGEVIPKGVHLLAKGIPSPLFFKEGALSFSNVGFTFSNLKVQSNHSSLTLDGFIKEGNMDLSTWGSIDLRQLLSFLQSPLSPNQIRSQMDEIQEVTGGAEIHLKWFGKTEEGVATLKEGEVRLKGVSLQHQKIPVPLSHIEGSLLLSSEQVRFVRLKGMVGNSPLTLSGGLSWFSPSKVLRAGAEELTTVPGKSLSFEVSSSQLDLDPLLPKKEEPAPTSFTKLKDWLSNWSFDGKIEIDQGKVRGLHYRELKGEMKTVDGKLVFRPFQLKGFEGDLWGEGWIGPAEKGIRFEIKPRFSNMEATAFLRTLLQKGEEERIAVTGKIYIDKVELRGEGEDFQKVKESLNGRLRLEVENGVIKKWRTLARIFSILNVSQLFWGRLPDLKTKGLPYRQITANILVKDGIASTEDFLVESDAIRITLIGKIDLGKNLIDAKIGVHPLVTLDMVLRNLPIAGYILTGKDKAFLSYIYEVKGDLDDPKIEAIPIKGLGENIWGIFQRLLETPLKPFQKTSYPSRENRN